MSQTTKKRLVAMVQHPMWLIIKEDSRCYECRPPWGEHDLQKYAQRLDANLKCLESNPQIRLQYDFSAAELMDMKESCPDLITRMQAAVKRTQLSFVNGTYSQAHLHTLSLEASIRQFQEGLRVIRELTGYEVRTYAPQEPGYTDQTPQLLNAFGYRYAYQGGFFKRMQADLHENWTPQEPFLAWRGLDGSHILAIAGEGLELTIINPDLRAFEPDPNATYVMYDEFLPTRERQHPAPWKAGRMWMPWSYLEGADAEMLIRGDAACETALVQLDTVAALLGKTVDSQALWQQWLFCQHHDAYWAGAPELRARCCERQHAILRSAKEQTGILLAGHFGAGQDGQDGVILGAVYPRAHQGVLSVEWGNKAPAGLRDAGGAAIPVQTAEYGGTTQVLVPYKFEGAGFAALACQSGRAGAPGKKPVNTPVEFTNDHFRTTINLDGSIGALAMCSGVQLLPSGDRDAVLAIGDTEFTPAKDGVTIQAGPVATVIESKGELQGIPVTRSAILYRDLPWFELHISCEFDNTSIGQFFFDETKMKMRWRLEERIMTDGWGYAEQTRLIHGIGGGVAVPDEPRTAFFPVNWLDIGHSHAGVSIINFGTLKHFQRERDIFAVLAWGGHTAQIGNRLHHTHPLGMEICRKYEKGYEWPGPIDLRLNGRHDFRFVVYPHYGDWRQAGVSDVAMALLRPPVALPCRLPDGPLPKDQALVSLEGSLIPTAMFAQDGKLVCRAYDSVGDDQPVTVRLGKKNISPTVCDVAGAPSALRPWGIYNLATATKLTGA